MKGYITTEEAAKKLGYEYSYFTRLLKEGRVPGAVYWHGYAIPKNVTREKLKPRSPRN